MPSASFAIEHYPRHDRAVHTAGQGPIADLSAPTAWILGTAAAPRCRIAARLGDLE